MAYGDRYGGSRFNERRSFAPVKVGDELDVKIEAVGEKGDGIAKKDGFVLFVPNTSEGDQVKVKVTKVLRRVGFAEVVGKSKGKAKAPTEEVEEPQEEEAPAEEPEAEDTEDFGEEAPTEEVEEPQEEEAPVEEEKPKEKKKKAKKK